MRRAVALGLLLAATALAGCSSSPDADVPSSLTSESLAPALGDLPGNLSLVASTDTLHLAPLARLAVNASSNLTILATLGGALPQTLSWNATLNGTGNLTHARLLLWLDLGNSAAQPGVGGDPGCTAALTLYFTVNKTVVGQAGGCASAGIGYVPPGEHALEFSTPLTAFPSGAIVSPGDQVLVQVSFGLSLPQGSGYVLGGGDRDSSLALAGLAEPVASAAVGPSGPA